MKKKDPQKSKDCLAKKIPSLNAYWKAQALKIKSQIAKVQGGGY